MQRTARLVLRRINKHGKRVRTRVEVQRITLGGFLDLVRTLAPKVAFEMVRLGRGLTETELAAACSDPSAYGHFADLVCVGRPVGFFRKWCSLASGAFVHENAAALLAASRAVEGDGQWTRYAGTLNRPAAGDGPETQKPKARGGGLAADADALAIRYGTTPDHFHAMPLRDFLDLCDSLNRTMDEAERDSEAYDPKLDPEAEPTPLPKRQVH